MIIYDNGKFLKADQTLLDSLAPGQTDCQGVFETLRVYDKKLFALGDHLKRFNRGMKIYARKDRLDPVKVRSIIRKLLDQNALENARVRTSLSFEGKKSRFSVACESLPSAASFSISLAYKTIISKQIKPKTRFSNVKSFDYAFFLDAFKEAKSQGFDEAIFLDSRGRVIEGTRTNLFCFLNERLVTPPVSCGCLNGVTRQHVLKVARKMGFSYEVRDLALKDLLNAKEVFVTNSIIEIVPVQSIAGRKDFKAPGEKTTALQRAFRIHVQKSLK